MNGSTHPVRKPTLLSSALLGSVMLTGCQVDNKNLGSSSMNTAEAPVHKMGVIGKQDVASGVAQSTELVGEYSLRARI